MKKNCNMEYKKILRIKMKKILIFKISEGSLKEINKNKISIEKIKTKWFRYLMLFLFTLILLNLLNFSFAKTTSNTEKLSKIIENKNDGYFKIVKTNFNLPTNLIKLKDNRILFVISGNMYIFDLNTNHIKKCNTKYNFETNRNTAILLNDGKILFIEPKIITPYEKFREQLKCTYDKCGILPYKEAEKIYLPEIRDNLDLMIQYNDYKYQYEEASMHGYIYDTEKDTLTPTKGKLNIRRYNPITLLLPDGKVLIYGGWIPRNNGGVISEYIVKYRDMLASQIEIYDPIKDKFELIQKQDFFIPAYEPILTKDGKVVIFFENFLNKRIYYTYFDPKTLTFTENRELPNIGGCHYTLRLKDGKMLFFSTVKNKFVIKEIEKHPYLSNTKVKEYYYDWASADSRFIFMFDSTKEEFSLVGQMAVPRGTNFIATELYDGRILIVGGNENEAKSGRGLFFDFPTKPQKKAEILNIETGKSTIIGSTHYPYYVTTSFISSLTDGRVLLYGHYNKLDIELYIPKVVEEDKGVCKKCIRKN